MRRVKSEPGAFLADDLTVTGEKPVRDGKNDANILFIAKLSTA